MTFKNKKIKLLFIIGIILLTIEVSFSFFMASTFMDNKTNPTTSTTVTLEDTKFEIEGNLSINDLNIYPGHKNISSIKVTATGDQEVNYDLVWNGTNEISNINYTVYKTTELVETTSNCIKKAEEENSTTKYYEKCNITNLVNLGSIISNGTITSNNLEQNITLKGNENIQATKEGTVVYYYVVLEFPNLNEEQNIDMNKKFDGIVTVESSQLNKNLSINDILAKYSKDDSRSDEITAGFAESTPTTVYSKEDDYGTSYVFAGVNPNNWVKIGSMYFRIIRFNGNGSMRLIYSGSGSAQMSGTGTQIGTKVFNSTYNDNMYVGLQYTSGQVHGTGTNSTILGETNSSDATTLYGWYNSNIKNTYGSLIDSNAGFCSDRDNYTNNTGTTAGGGTGTTVTYYGARIRYVKGGSYQTSYTPMIKCKNSADLLKLPVGLITADEYTLAGGGFPSSSSYYNTKFWLHTGENYWTMSPSYVDISSYACVFNVHTSGFLYGNNNVRTLVGVRPVINLKANTKFLSGNYDGSAEKPWTVQI